MLAEHPDALVLAGGTDLMVEINDGHRRPDDVVVGGQPGARTRSWRTTPPPRTLTIGAGDHLQRAAERTAGHVRRRRWPRPRARSVRRRSATPARSAATSAPARPPATVCRCSPRSTPPSRSRRRPASAPCPCGEFMIGVKRTAIEPGELIVAITVPLLAAGRATPRSGCATRWSSPWPAPASSSTRPIGAVRARPRVGRPDDHAVPRGRGAARRRASTGPR